MSTCSNQYECQAQPSLDPVELLYQTLLNFIIRPRNQRKVRRYLQHHLDKIGLYNLALRCHYWIIATVFIYVNIWILRVTFELAFRLIVPVVDVESDTEPFEEPPKEGDSADGHYNRCMICLSDFERSKRRVAKLDCCEHAFHLRCIDKWFRENGYGECPLCRQVSSKVYIYNRLSQNPIVQHMLSNYCKIRLISKTDRPPEVHPPPEFAMIVAEFLRQIQLAHEHNQNMEDEIDTSDCDFAPLDCEDEEYEEYEE